MSTTAAGLALVLGEALVDVVERPDGSRRAHPGGSPANVAIGLGRLGRDVALGTWLGDDADGDLVRRHLVESHVDVLDGDRRAPATSVATARLDAAGVATYDFDLAWDLAATEPARPPLVVHTGSIATVLEPGATRVREQVEHRRPASTVTYDPNLRPQVMGSPERALPYVEALLRVADVVKVSDEDLAWLHPGADPVSVAARWAGLGPALVVVTRGGAGAVARTSRGSQVDVVAPRVDVVDTVGAGDSFMSGLVDGLWSAGLLGADRRDHLHAVDDATIAAILTRCTRIAAITVARAGANPPWARELDTATS